MTSVDHSLKTRFRRLRQRAHTQILRKQTDSQTDRHAFVCTHKKMVTAGPQHTHNISTRISQTRTFDKVGDGPERSDGGKTRVDIRPLSHESAQAIH